MKFHPMEILEEQKPELTGRLGKEVKSTDPLTSRSCGHCGRASPRQVPESKQLYEQSHLPPGINRTAGTKEGTLPGRKALTARPRLYRNHSPPAYCGSKTH